MHGELALYEGVRAYEIEIEELTEQLGIDKNILNKVIDLTIYIIPISVKKWEDVRDLIKDIYDKIVTNLGTQALSLKIRVFGEKKQLDNIVKNINILLKDKPRIYLSKNKVTIVPKPSQIIDDSLYEAIYGKIGRLRILRMELLGK